MIEETIISGIIVAVVAGVILDRSKRGEFLNTLRGFINWVKEKTKSLADYILRIK